MQAGLEKYYKLLGLHSNATPVEVKKRYRKLALIHHPDKNDGDDTQFIALTEAYEIIIGKKILPQHTITTSRSTSSVAQKSKEERIKEAQQRYKDQVYNEYVENDRYFKKLTTGRTWKIIQLNAVFGTVIALLLFIEPFLPKHLEDARVERFSIYSYNSINQTRASLIALDNGEEMFVANINYGLYGEYADVAIERSWFLHNPLRILAKHPNYYEPFIVEFSIGAHAIWIGLLLLFPLATVLYKKRTISFTVLYHMSLYGISILLLYILLSNDRWAHLLTLGFL